MTIDKDKAVEAQRRAHTKNGYNVDDKLLTAKQLRELFDERDEAIRERDSNAQKHSDELNELQALASQYKADAERFEYHYTKSIAKEFEQAGELVPTLEKWRLFIDTQRGVK